MGLLAELEMDSLFLPLNLDGLRGCRQVCRSLGLEALAASSSLLEGSRHAGRKLAQPGDPHAEGSQSASHATAVVGVDQHRRPG